MPKAGDQVEWIMDDQFFQVTDPIPMDSFGKVVGFFDSH